MLLSIEELEKLSNCEGVGRDVLEKRIRILVDHIKKERFESEMDVDCTMLRYRESKHCRS